MRKPKRRLYSWVLCGTHSHLSKQSVHVIHLRQTVDLYLRKYPSPPKTAYQLAAVSRWTSDLLCNINPALLLLDHFLFFIPQQMVKHIHTRSLTLMLQHPEEASRLLSQLFLFFSPNFYSSNTRFLAPQGCT